MSLRTTVHEYLEKQPSHLGPKLVQGGIGVLILASVMAQVVGTVSTEVGGAWVPLETQHAAVFAWIENVCVLVFSVEYLLRLWSITVDPRYRRPIAGRIRHAMTPLALIDLIAILPAYFEIRWLVTARSVRLVRVLRLLKLAHYSRALQSLGQAISSRRGELALTVFAVAVLLVLASTVLYHAEYEAQPDRFSSIPAAMWWGIVTLTTVGYGDLTPVTPLGKCAGALVALFGVGLVALPAGIMGSAFVQQLSSPQKQKCPHCGKEL